jgi:beta-1,4-mannosyl-glycoprotein beta-1,4-N-acetylglucosaminyltransferase
MSESSPKIIDCFIFYNEIDLLTYRLNTLNPVVDYFILIESTHTFVGKEKPLHYNENKSMFGQFNDKIIHIIVDMLYKHPTINISNGEQWDNERFQRNSIKQGIDNLELQNNDIITICDVDEIPDTALLLAVKRQWVPITINSMEMDFYYYNLTTRFSDKWLHPKILSYEKYRQLNITIDNIRHTPCNSIKYAGWHLSYFGDAKFIQNKLNNFSHQEYNYEEYTNLEKIEHRVSTNRDLFERCSIQKIEISDNNYLPKYYDIYLSKYCV